MKFLAAALLLFATTGLLAQSIPEKSLNTGFETWKNGIPDGWSAFGAGDAFTISADSAVRHSGKYSLAISCAGDCSGFKAIGLKLPQNYQGQAITLSGWLRTENVKDGYAGLWMRIDPELGFDNMYNRGVRGTTDWKPFSITLPMLPQKTKAIVIGALLSGASGKMWVDDLEIRIDDKPLDKAQPFIVKSYPAEKDTAFSTHSPVPVLTLNARKADYLQTLGLVWGFLKYYHPAIAEGRYNWDNELFRFLPQYLAAVEDTSERNAMLYGWVKSLGNFEAGPVLPPLPKAKLRPDLDWIQTSGFSPQLRDLLEQIRYARRPKEPYYVELNGGVANPVFLHEIAYENAHFPDAGMQLLSLYRYWNMVQYFFPYKSLIGEDWKSVLGEFIPRFAGAQSDTAYVFAVQELIGRIHDSHANVWGDNKILNGYFGRYYPALVLAMIDSQLVVKGYVQDSLGRESGLQVGDVVTHIKGRRVLNILEKEKLRFPASNDAALKRDFADAALRSNDSLVSVTRMRNGQAQSIRVPLYGRQVLYSLGISQQKGPSFRMLSGDIAYVNNGILRRDTLAAIWPQLQKARALIIDDRNYPSDFPIHDFCNYLLPKPTVFYHATRPSLEQPGLFVFDTPQPTGKKNKDYFKGKVAILVNEETQSRAEFHAMAYQTHPNAKVVGSTTAGADGNVSEIILPGGIQTMFSGIGIYYPDGRETQRTGIAIDIVAKPTAAGIAAGKDEVLERALEWIEAGK